MDMVLTPARKGMLPEDLCHEPLDGGTKCSRKTEIVSGDFSFDAQAHLMVGGLVLRYW
jgi:hypothetical protein